MIKYAMLGLLREQADYGYSLRQRFEDRLGTVWRLNSGQVYQTLRRLERSGLVVESEPDAPTEPTDLSHPARRVFRLTAKGVRVLERWLTRPPSYSSPARDETLLRLMVLDPERRQAAIEQIQKLTQVYTKKIAVLLSQKRRLLRPGEASLVRDVGLEAALLHAEAHLKWLEYTKARLEEDAQRPPA